MSIGQSPVQQDFDLRSEDLSEILGTPPGWLVRWGTTVVLAAFALLLLAGWMIRYPDVITARVVFTTEKPPVEVVARTEGHIEHLFVTENQEVDEGQPLVVLQNTASYNDVVALEQKLVAWESASTSDSLLLIAPLPGSPQLGELRGDYAAFLQQFETYRFSRNSRSGAATANIGTVEAQIAQLNRSITLDLDNQRRAATQLQTARAALERQRKALDEGLISRNAFEDEQRRLSLTEQQYNTYTQTVLQKRTEISGLQRSIGIVRFDEKLDANSAAGRLQASLGALRSSLDRWKQAYLLSAPTRGNVSLSKFFAVQQYVKQGEQVLTVVPPPNSKIIGRSLLPIAGSGKVESGQRVVIRLDNYPYYEYGTLRGVVQNKSTVPKDNAYAVTIVLDSISGTTTNYNRTIPFQQQIQGEADIVTADRRFLQRIVDQLFASAR